MRLPDYEEGLLIAGLVLGVDRDEVPPMIRGERLHQAIMVPSAHAGGSPVYRGQAVIAKTLFVECALGRILPTVHDDFRFGWLMMQRALELSGCRWRRPKGHEARFEELRQQLAEGVDPGQELVVWLGEGIQPPYGPPAQEEPRPIHVTSPMHPAPEVDMTEWANAVDDGLTRFLEERNGGDTAFTHRPQIFPVQVLSEAELHNAIEERIHTADGLVVLAPQSSWGAAIELEAGLRGLIPTVFIHPADAPPSERTRSHLEAMGTTILEIDGSLGDAEAPKAVEELVYRWLTGSFSLILGTRRRRACMEARYSRFLAGVRTKRTQMTEQGEKRALAAAGLSLERARTLVEETWGLLSASFVEMVRLGNAYGVPANIDAIVEEPVSDRPPYLTPREVAALDAFVEDRGLSPADSVRLTVAGQREVVQPGRRRKLLTDSSKWQEVWDQEQETG